MTKPVKASKVFGAGDFIGINNIQYPTPTSFDTPQDMTLSVKRSLKSIYGTDQFPDDVNAGSTDITGKVTSGSPNGRVWSDLIAGVPVGAGGKITNLARREKGVVNGSLRIVVKNNGSGIFLRDCGVRGPENLPLIRVGTITQTKHYKVDADGTYHFHSSREGDTLDISYEWSGAGNGLGAIYNITNQPQGAIGDFTAVMATRWRTEQNIFTLYSCLTSDWELATKGSDYAKPTLSFMAQADPNGNVGTASFAQQR